jgi:hypothetical protein
MTRGAEAGAYLCRLACWRAKTGDSVVSIRWSEVRDRIAKVWRGLRCWVVGGGWGGWVV